MKKQITKIKLTPGSFFCEDCLSKEPQLPQDRATVDFSEAKEEETECYYCNLSGMFRPAEVLFNGFPSCRECRRRRNVMNFVAKTNESNQKVIVTQVGLNKDLDRTNASFHKNKESVSSSKQYYGSQDQQQIPREKTHPTNQSMALPINLSQALAEINSKPRKKDLSMTSARYQAKENPLMISFEDDEDEEDEGGGGDLNQILPNQMRVMQAPHTTRNDRRTKTQAGVDLLRVFKNPNSSLQKPDPAISDPKVIDFFKKVNESGHQSVKSQLLFTSSAEGFSGRKFHQKCDKKNPIILLITLENGFIIGGFSYKGIDPKTIDVTDILCGLFCTYDSKKIDFYKVPGTKIVYQPNGIAFGSPAALSLNLEELNTFVCNLELGYYDPTGKKVLFSLGEKIEWDKVIKEFSVYLMK